MQRIRVFGVLVVLSLGAAACGFERTRSMTTPSDTPGSTAPVPSGGPGTMTGTWTSAPLDFPASWSCGSFQYNITSQTANSIAGEIRAVCAGVVTVTATASGQMTSSTDVTLAANGTAVLQNTIPCAFALTGTGHLDDPNTLTIRYQGDTCLGPVHGEETLRRPSPSQPEPAPPPPPPPPPPSSNPNHVPDGPLTEERAQQVVFATANEFPHLTGSHPTDGEAIRAAEELLLRIIWHLELAGFDAARQRNPSGAISNDKLTIFLDGQWAAYDVFMDYGGANQPIRMIFLWVEPPNPVQYPGIPD